MAPGGSLTLQRHWDGIGDWLFCLAVLKMVNRQRPYVPVHVDFSASRARAGLPRIVRDLYEDSDVTWRPGIGAPPTMITRDSLVYRKWPPVLYIESTVEHLNDQTGLGIRYEPGVFPTFRSAKPAHEIGDHVCIIAQGKRRERTGKEWGFLNFLLLARELHRRGVNLVQIGRASDPHLQGVSRRVLGAHGTEVVRTLSTARAFIGIENGVMVLAGFLGVPQVTIYDGHSNPSRCDFAGQAKLTKKIEPPEAAERIFHWLQSGALC